MKATLFSNSMIYYDKIFPMLTVSLTDRFYVDVRRNFNEMQMIFDAISGNSGQVPLTLIGGYEMYYALWE